MTVSRPQQIRTPKKKQKQQSIAYVHTLGSDFSTLTSCDTYLMVQNLACDDKIGGLALNDFEGIQNFARCSWSKGAADILGCPNAGGASERSEAASFEFIRRCFGAELEKTEMAIEYNWTISKRTDFSVKLFGRIIGVSVTRAMTYGQKVFSAEDAKRLLHKKLFGVIMSSKDVIERDSWDKQILHIWAQQGYIADLLQQEYMKLKARSPRLVSNTVVLITRAHRANWIFTNKDAA